MYYDGNVRDDKICARGNYIIVEWTGLFLVEGIQWDYGSVGKRFFFY